MLSSQLSMGATMPQEAFVGTARRLEPLAVNIKIACRYRSPNSLAPGHRSFSWRTKCLRDSSQGASIYQPSITYKSPLIYRSNKPIYRSYFWKRGHFLNQYTQSPEWRLLSSWGRLGGKTQNGIGKSRGDGRDQEDRDFDWYSEWQRQHAQSLKNFEEFKKLIDEDPYGALFGRRISTVNERRDRDPTITHDKSHAGRSAPQSDDGAVNAPKSRRPDEPISSPKSAQDQHQSCANLGPSVDSSQEYVIDPITMRKVSKRKLSMPVEESANDSIRSSKTESFDIPVRKFKTPVPEQNIQTTTNDTKVHPTIQKLERDGEDWLAQEGFGTKTTSAKSSSTEKLQPPSKIESALQRHLQKKQDTTNAELKSKPDLSYNPVDPTTEDIDLLTASDIRASAGHAKKPPPETAQEKQLRRKTLESDYQERPQRLDKRLEAELASSREHSEKEMMQELHDIAKDVRNRDIARISHEQEVQSHKDAMDAHEASRKNIEQPEPTTSDNTIQTGEGDMALNVHEFTGRDRWYKRKAPHATAAVEQKLLQASKDKAFVQEIQSIYEDAYGTIDTQHRQAPMQQVVDTSEYPADAYPGTIYEQPWSANVLNDHPDIDSQGSTTMDHQPKAKRQHTEQQYQALSLIGKLFGELRENEALLQDKKPELQKLHTRDGSRDLFKSLKAHEQRVMNTLKIAQSVIKSTTCDAQATKPYGIATLPGQDVEPTSTTFAQPSSAADAATAALTTSYRILAYDPLTRNLATTETNTMIEPPAEKILSFSEALSGLEHPAKFLPYFSSLDNGEYEIVAGGPNILVFKQTRLVHPQAESKDTPGDLAKSTNDLPPRFANPIDGTTTQIGNFASPTGFVNYDPPYPAPEPSEESLEAPKPQAWKSRPKDKIRRQEDVFSGSARRPWQDNTENQRSKSKKKFRKSTQRRRTLRRMFLVGVLTAGGCYAVGVASEMLRIQ